MGRVERARFAAASAYTSAGQAVQDRRDTSYSSDEPQFVEAGNFVLSDRTAPADAIPIHLALKKLGGSMSPSAVDIMLWGVFKSTLLAVHDHLKAIDDAEAAAKAQPEPSSGLPLDRAMKVEDAPFSASGFSTRA